MIEAILPTKSHGYVVITSISCASRSLSREGMWALPCVLWQRRVGASSKTPGVWLSRDIFLLVSLSVLPCVPSGQEIPPVLWVCPQPEVTQGSHTPELPPAATDGAGSHPGLLFQRMLANNFFPLIWQLLPLLCKSSEEPPFSSCFSI